MLLTIRPSIGLRQSSLGITPSERQLAPILPLLEAPPAAAAALLWVQAYPELRLSTYTRNCVQLPEIRRGYRGPKSPGHTTTRSPCMVILLIIITRNKCSDKLLFFFFPIRFFLLTDKDSLSHRSHHHHHHHQQHPPPPPPPPSYVGNGNSSTSGHGIPHDLQHSGAGSYSNQQAAAHPYMRRGSVDYGGSDGSVPSSADSSSVHLPLDGLSMQQAQTSHSLGYNVSSNSFLN